MPTYLVKAHRLLNHSAWVTARNPEEARQKYLDDDLEWEDLEDQGILHSSIHIEKDGPQDE